MLIVKLIFCGVFCALILVGTILFGIYLFSIHQGIWVIPEVIIGTILWLEGFKQFGNGRL